ncbi:MAG: hypothetical protein LBH93_07915, partial [Chitinispirillales bacterium]|nr:hypothetical protein [Chitinispirillales bacterium]
MRVVTVLILFAAALASAATLSPKQRVEREFRQLETALARCMYEEVLTSPEIEFMNRALYDFMRDNPAVTRILRANAGGFTVNDISASSPLSAPPRNISSQRWFQHITQGKTPYYSMDIDADGQIVLFYAWPLSANTDKEAFTGAFAAYIDFTSQVALIDDAPPFRIMYQGKPVFEHDWDDIDYAEEPLTVKGARDLAIRTLKPFPTRLDPRAPSTYRSSSSSFGGPLSERLGYGQPSPPYSDYEDEDEDEASIADAKTKNASGWDAYGGLMSKVIFALLVIIAIMLAYSIFGNKGGRADARTASGMPVVPE